MEVKELRVGNYIYSKSGLLEGGNMEISDISSDSVATVAVANINFSEHYNINSKKEVEIKPLKFTNDILLKLGFKAEEPYFFKESSKDVKIRCKAVGDKYIFDYNDDEIFVDALPGIKYVHQLQNKYFELTGEELTFINT